MADPGGSRGLTHVEIPVGEFVFDAVADGPEDGALVLLLHGFPQSSYVWRHQLPALAEAGYRAVAPDQRGYSPRARPDGVDAYHVDRLVADVLAMADWLGGHRSLRSGHAGRFHLVGDDWGAVAAWVLAARYPQRLRSLTSVSTPHPLALAHAIATPSTDQAKRSAYIQFFRQPEIPEQVLLRDECAGLRALFANTDFHDREAIERYVEVLCDPAALTAALNWYRALRLSSLANMDRIQTPTLYVWSTEDPALGREAAESTASYVEGSYRFEVFEGISHWIPEDAPADLNRVLLEHLAISDATRHSVSRP